MSRNNLSADQAFGRLRDYSRRTGAKLVDVAVAVTTSHRMLLPGAPEPAVALAASAQRSGGSDG
jgi:ANTAR domain